MVTPQEIDIGNLEASNIHSNFALKNKANNEENN